MAQATRPLSPHLQVYRWYFTMALSIFHRASGCALAAGLILLTWWIMALATSEAAFGVVHGIVQSWFGGLVLFGFTAALFYHGANGVRHLFWDIGWGLEKEAAAASGKITVGVAAGLTLLTWLVILI